MIAAPSATKRPDNKPARQMVAYKNGQGTPGRVCYNFMRGKPSREYCHLAAVGSGFGLSDSELR